MAMQQLTLELTNGATPTIAARLMRALFLTSALALAAALPAHATVSTARSLEMACQVAEEICEGYILAVADVLASGNAVGQFKACIPDQMNRIVILAAVKTFMEDNPQSRSDPAVSVIAAALAQAYPCRSL